MLSHLIFSFTFFQPILKTCFKVIIKVLNEETKNIIKDVLKKSWLTVSENKI